LATTVESEMQMNWQRLSMAIFGAAMLAAYAGVLLGLSDVMKVNAASLMTLTGCAVGCVAAAFSFIASIGTHRRAR
jgi:hypothetical protein